jgi:membrane protein required for colicin V production
MRVVFAACWHDAIVVAAIDSHSQGKPPAARSPALPLDAAVEKYYDLIMALVLIGTTIFGYWKGMAWQLASIASLIVSYFGALRFSESLAPVIGLDPPLNRFAAMLLIYMFSSFIIWMLFRLVAGAIDKVRLESFDRQLGAIFGLAKGALLCVVITFFAVTFLPEQQGQQIVASSSGQFIARQLREKRSIVPPEIQQVVGPYLDKVEQRLNPGIQSHPGLQTNFPQPQGAQPNQPAAAWPPINMSIPDAIKSQLPQIQWPPTGGSPSSPPAQYDPYSPPREPNPFPTPYSAGVPGGRDY